jgi:hypothetical protein
MCFRNADGQRTSKEDSMRRLTLMALIAGTVVVPSSRIGTAEPVTKGARADVSSSEQRKKKIDIENQFTTSGWMGDGQYGRKYVQFDGANTTNPHSGSTSIQISYTFGPTRWAGIYWQNKPDNWGDEPGEDYSKAGVSKVTFWARGDKGTEVVEFKAGGIKRSGAPHRESFEATIGRVRLTKDWTKYEVDLSSADLKSVIGGFCWVASADYNPGKSMTFFIDGIVME